MSEVPRKAEWCLTFDDGSDRLTVSFDTTSQHLPESVTVRSSDDFMLYLDLNEIEWVAARILDAKAAITKARGLT